jgi:hypothetical protein
MGLVVEGLSEWVEYSIAGGILFSLLFYVYKTFCRKSNASKDGFEEVNDG